MSQARGLLLLTLAALSAGCLGGPKLGLEGAFEQSEAHYDAAAGRYAVTVQGRVVNAGDRSAVGVLAFFGLRGDCLAEPALPHSVTVGNLAPGNAANLRASFEQAGPAVASLRLWYKLTIDGGTAARGCGDLPVD